MKRKGMAPVTNLYLVRHGETEWNAEGRYQGQANPALNEPGQHQAERLAEALRDIKFEAAYTSDLDRAQSTAEIIGDDTQWIFADPRWRELSFGEWEGKRFEDIAELDSDRLRDWVKDPSACPPPGGESLQEFSERVQAAASELCKEFPNGNVLVITHGGPIRCLVAEWVLGGLHRMSDVHTELGSVTLMSVQPAEDEESGWNAQVKEFEALRAARHA